MKTRRKCKDEALRDARGEPERLAEERVAELAKANASLKAELGELKRAEQKLGSSERRKAILNEIADIFLTVLDEEIYAKVVAVVLRTMNSRFGYFGFIGENGDLIIPSLTREIWSECQVPGKSIVFPPVSWGESLWGRAIREKKASYSDGPFHTPEGHILIDHFLTVPIVFGQETVGLISVANSERSYTEGDKDLLVTIANYISPILNARLQRDRQEQKRKRAEEALRESERRVRRKLDAILSPEADIGALELSDIIDSEKIQKLMDEFYQLTNIGIGIIDLNGRVLVGTGWQDICTKFHRINPESRRLCIESDLELSRGVPVGTFKQYRCKNNMWDIATPIMLGDKHVGNIFLGQFLFDDETPNYKAFRQQAYRYGFNEQEYIAALDRVPRWSRKMVNAAMSFYTAFAGMIGNLSYSNIKLASALEERKRVEEVLRSTTVRLNEAQRLAHMGNWELDLTSNVLTWSDEIYRIFEIDPKEFAASYGAFLGAIHPDDREAVDLAYTNSLKTRTPYSIGHRLLFSDGRIKYVHEQCETFYDNDKPIRSVGTVQDVTEFKRAEEALHTSEERFRTVLENSPISIWEEDFSGVKTLFDDLRKEGVTDIETHFAQHPETVRQCADIAKIVGVNRAGLALHAAANKEELLAGLVNTFTPESFDTFQQELVCLWNGGAEMIRDGVVKTLAGDPRNVTVHFSVCPGHEDTFSKVLVSLVDITERKRNEAINVARLHLVQFSLKHSLDELLEETLNETEKLTGSLIGFYHFVEDDQKSLTLQNWSTRTKAEFCRAEGKGLHYAIDEAGVWVDCVHQRKAVIHNDYKSLPHRKGLPIDHAAVIRELVVPVFRGGKVSAILGVGNKPADYTEKDVETVSLIADLAWEIAERKRAEEVLRHLNRELRAISSCNQTLLRAVDEQDLIKEICRIICDEADYRLAWVGFAESDEAKTVRPVAWAGFESGYIQRARLTWADDTERGRGPAGMAIRSGETICIQDFTTDPRMAPWREDALQRGYRSCIALPLKDENSIVFGVLLIYSAEANVITPEEIRLLEELSGDLAFGIITLRTRAEREQAEAEVNKLSLAVEQNPVSIVITDNAGNIEYVNPKFTQITGYAREEAIGKNPRLLKSGETPPEEYKRLWEVITNGGVWRGEFHNKKKSGELYWESASISPVIDSQGNIKHFVAVKEDITERKRAEEELLRLSSAAELSPISIVVSDLEGRIIYVNRVTVEKYGARNKSELIGKSAFDFIAPVHREQAIRGMNETLTLGKTESREYLIATMTGDTLPVEMSAALMKDREGKPIGFVAVSRDITERKRAEEQLQQSMVQLQTTLKAAINTLSSAIELRDPYTAGHQERVTKLAIAIAQEMGLAGEQIEGVQIAGIIHDIGKLHIPAEILSKPSTLTNIEYMLIKTHAEAGFKILSNIDFPWPIAQIVYQHHECMNGSGYPRGLSGKDILIESRILSVADVVEAMSSHRPYRPALGIEKALQEIQLRRGTSYDADVVDACIRLFAENRFQF